MTNLTMPLPIDPSLPSPEQSISRIAAECRRLGILFGTAESCTGGLIGALVTDISGVSEVFAGSVVSYANDVKTRVLGVTVETLAQHGAVSAETARSMAEGACRCLGCGAAVSVTGIAGPGGGTPEKPVGTVYSAVCVAGRATVVRRFDWGADRSRADIRHTTACAALAFLSDELMETQP